KGIGFPGGASFRLKTRVDGLPVPLAQCNGFGVLSAPGVLARPFLPPLAWACSRAAKVEGCDHREQLTHLAWIHAVMGSAAGLLPGRLEFAPRGLLAEFQPRMAERLELRWERSSSGNTHSLKVYVVLEDGRREELSLAHLQAGG